MSAPKELKTPYNFVPLSSKVILPEWADQVSHDLPFEDGLSGSFDLLIEAKTPIFTRDDKDPEAFLNIQGQPFIKGSSIKGMLREVVKIAAFGKMDTADDNRFAFREMQDKGDYLTMMKGVKSGWLKKDVDGKTTIIPCENARIHKKLLSKLQSSAYHQWKYEVSMPEKYSTWRGSLELRASVIKGKYDFQATPDDRGEHLGTIVFTGHISKKTGEYFFYAPRPDKARPVGEDVFQGFDQVHRASQQKPQMKGIEPNDQWGYWKPKFAAGEPVPVFYRESNGEVIDFGLARMYRLPSNTGVHGGIKAASPDHLDLSTFDLCDLLFGYAADKDKHRGSLKGRVSFSHASLENSPKVLPRVSVALQTPKASFHPGYLEQPAVIGGKQSLSTWMDRNAKIRGWKRYPARGSVDKTPMKADRDDMNTAFKPLDKGALFRSRVYFHNLRPQELGALLWSLHFGDYIDGLVHRLGLARPYGYGEVQLSAENLDLLCNDPQKEAPTQEDLQTCFESWLSSKEANWRTEESIIALLAMANPSYGDPETLRYEDGPTTTKTRGENQPKSKNAFNEAALGNLKFPAPSGIAETGERLKEREIALQREALAAKQAWLKGLTPPERARYIVEEEVYTEEIAVQWTKEKIHEKGIEDDVERDALRQALYEIYYPKWSKGKEVTIIGVAAGAAKLKEYASLLLPEGEEDPSGGTGEPKGPYDDLPEVEATPLKDISSQENPKGPFKKFWNGIKTSLSNWSSDGLRAVLALNEDALRAGNTLKKMHKKDRKVYEEVIDKITTELKSRGEEP